MGRKAVCPLPWASLNKQHEAWARRPPGVHMLSVGDAHFPRGCGLTPSDDDACRGAWAHVKMTMTWETTILYTVRQPRSCGSTAYLRSVVGICTGSARDSEWRNILLSAFYV